MSLFEYEKPMAGPLRITNPKTLEKWKENGKYKELMDKGYIYAKGCGRFRVEVCACHKCRRRDKKIMGVVWLEDCSSCKRKHRVTMQPCPECGVHETPQPESEKVHETCNADYACDGCDAYRDHQV
jgi:hypothetical protein